MIHIFTTDLQQCRCQVDTCLPVRSDKKFAGCVQKRASEINARAFQGSGMGFGIIPEYLFTRQIEIISAYFQVAGNDNAPLFLYLIDM